jgi:hypothetical protein
MLKSIFQASGNMWELRQEGVSTDVFGSGRGSVAIDDNVIGYEATDWSNAPALV